MLGVMSENHKMEAGSSSSLNQPTTLCECIVCSLLSRKNSSLTPTEKQEIIAWGRPKPHLKNLTTKAKHCTRFFKAEIYNQFEWLTGCEVLCKLFCWPCLLSSPEKTVWNRKGFSDLNNVHRAVRRHMKTRNHLIAVMKEKQCVRSSIICVIDDDNLKIEHNELVSKNRAVLKRLIDIVLFLASHDGLGSRNDGELNKDESFFDLISLLSKYDTLLMNEQSSSFRRTLDDIRADLIYAIGTVVLERLKSDVKSSHFVALIINETTDATHAKQLSVVLRYLTDADGIQERFVGFPETTDRTFNSLFEVVCDVVNNFNCSGSIVAQSYDGAAVVPEQLNKLEAKVKDLLPRAIFVPCYAHRFDFILAQSLGEIKECKVFFSTLRRLSEFFSKSTKRTQAFDCITQKRLSTDVSVVEWNSIGRLVHTVYEYKQVFIEFFESILEDACEWDGDTLISSKNYLESLKEDFSFSFLLNLFSEILPACDDLFESLQDNPNNVEEFLNRIETLKTVVNTQRDDFDRIWNNTMEMWEETTKKEFEQRKRMRIDNSADLKTSYHTLMLEAVYQISEQIAVRFGSIAELKFIELCNFNKGPADCLPEEALEPLASDRNYGNYFDVNALRTELTVLSENKDTNTQLNASEMLKYLKETGLDKAFCEVMKMCELAIILPLTRAYDKSSFSLYKRIADFVRISTREDRLSYLGLLSIENVLVKEMSAHPHFYDDIIEEFSLKHEEMKLHYK